MDYKGAVEYYAKFGVDVEAAIRRVASIPVSMHCWQGDDVRGFENPDGDLTGGIQTTGNYPGRASTIDRLRADFDKASSLIPGKKRINLHAIYLDADGESVGRCDIEPKHFDSWISWAKARGIGIDFNPTCFSHPMSESGLTLSSPDKAVRDFWIEHCKRSRAIAEHIGKELGQTVVTNYWVPDGMKDTPADRLAMREHLRDSLDEIFARPVDPKYNRDAVEGKVFGIGAESFTTGSNDFYLAYALSRGKLWTLDAGHFHPTEFISDKISTALSFMPEILLHVSRPVRWDSDHVVTYDDELRAIACEILRAGADDRVHIGLDFFDSSINRVAAWIIGTRNMEKALLYAALEPSAMLAEYERIGDYTSRLALMEEIKTFPFYEVWTHYCETQNVPTDGAWLDEVRAYERKTLDGTSTPLSASLYVADKYAL